MGRKDLWRKDGFHALKYHAQRGHVEGPSVYQHRDALAWMDKLGLPVDISTYASLLTHTNSLSKVKRVHTHILSHGFHHLPYLNNLLILMYGNCGSLPDARSVFTHMPLRNAFSWNIMINACVRNHHGLEALEVFKQMPSHGIQPDKVTFVSVLSVCAQHAVLCEGEHVQCIIENEGIALDIPIGTALLNMYSRCGMLLQANEVFDQMRERNVIAWSAMITAYGQHGDGINAIHLFRQMKAEGIAPCEVAFVSVLSACGHTGLIDEGFHLFISMVRENNIVPNEEHYNCMIDLLCRAGRLSEGEDMMRHFKPSILSWITLLSACKMNRDLQRAARAAEQIFKLDPENTKMCKLLSSIHFAVELDVEMLDASHLWIVRYAG